MTADNPRWLKVINWKSKIIDGLKKQEHTNDFDEAAKQFCYYFSLEALDNLKYVGEVVEAYVESKTVGWIKIIERLNETPFSDEVYSNLLSPINTYLLRTKNILTLQDKKIKAGQVIVHLEPMHPFYQASSNPQEVRNLSDLKGFSQLESSQVGSLIMGSILDHSISSIFSILDPETFCRQLNEADRIAVNRR